MAVRPVFIPTLSGNVLSITKDLDFPWAPGMAKVQKQKSIRALHAAANVQGLAALLEISSKSEDELGVALSAFNLRIKTKKLAKEFTVESAFQASKVFEYGGPYVDLLYKSSRDAKKDMRLRESGNIIGFKFYDTTWSLIPRTAFYDWLYLSALNQNKDLAQHLLNFDGFTDIEFNPVKSINCQARAAALFVSLTKRNMLEKVLSAQDNFLSILSSHYGVDDFSIQNQLI
ncbi:DarT1-associated NADAR antitoxin family protein [Pectobacterium carotovorum]|uniref:DarT1-associated NADAR antitoxin family protein n=1 Tax=Pectobacterium carotovorum TaxID=554 RepID=UPI0037F1CEFB